MEIQNKSLAGYIGSCVSDFGYDDFMPPINKRVLLDKFKALIEKSNSYWELYNPEDNGPNWIFIQLKSFQNKKVVRVGLEFSNKSIKYVVFGEIVGSYFEPLYSKGEIDLFRVWLDHAYLQDKLLGIIDNGIKRANYSE